MRAAWSAVLVVLRRRLLAIATKVAPQLLMVKSATKIERVIEDEVIQCLEDCQAIEIRRVEGQSYLPRGGPRPAVRGATVESEATAEDDV